MATKTPIVTLSTEDALVFQQISESGEEDVISLAEGLGMRRQRVMASLERLRHKGLVRVKRTADDWWVYMSTRGKEISRYMWGDMPSVSMI